MGVTFSQNKDDQKITINVTGDFDFSFQKEFRATYENYDSGKQFVIDLNGTDSINSAGLGILMAMRTKLGGEGAKIEIINCNSSVREIMAVFHLEKYFTINEKRTGVSG